MKPRLKVRLPGTTYNLAKEDEVEAYNEELLQLLGKELQYEMGGEVTGPGTGTPDLCQPDYLAVIVLTAKAACGAGNEIGDIGAARMCYMMAELESMA